MNPLRSEISRRLKDLCVRLNAHSAPTYPSRVWVLQLDSSLERLERSLLARVTRERREGE